MKILAKFAAVSLLLLGLPQTALADHFLAVPMRYQERNQWCWNASSQMAAFFYERYYATQCKIAEMVRIRPGTGWGTTNCCLNPDVGCNNPGGVGYELNSLGVGTSDTGVLSFAQAQAEIDAAHPFITHVYGSHFNTVWGYYTSTPTTMLGVNDPLPSSGIQMLDYTWYAAQWDETTKTTGRTTDQAQVWQNSNYGGSSSTVTTGTSTLPGSLNNQVSSMKVRGFPYIMYDSNNYGGTAWGVNPRDYSDYTKWYGTDNSISSARPVPGSTGAWWNATVVLFEDGNFQGASQIITANNENLVNIGWNDRVSSLVVIGGLAQVFQDINSGGLAYAVTSDGGPNHDGFYPNWDAWGGPNDDISSIHLYGDDMTPTSTTSPIVLYQGANFTGRALLIKWVAAINGDNPIAWGSDLGNQGMDNNVGSIRTYAGGWCLYTEPYFGGTNYVCPGPGGWFKNSTEIGLTGISSVIFAGAGWYF